MLAVGMRTFKGWHWCWPQQVLAVLRTLRLSQGKDKPIEKMFGNSMFWRKQEVQNCISPMSECPPECHGGNGLTSLSVLLRNASIPKPHFV